jgi:hypothetical protein
LIAWPHPNPTPSTQRRNHPPYRSSRSPGLLSQTSQGNWPLFGNTFKNNQHPFSWCPARSFLTEFCFQCLTQVSVLGLVSLTGTSGVFSPTLMAPRPRLDLKQSSSWLRLSPVWSSSVGLQKAPDPQLHHYGSSVGFRLSR